MDLCQGHFPTRQITTKLSKSLIQDTSNPHEGELGSCWGSWNWQGIVGRSGVSLWLWGLKTGPILGHVMATTLSVPTEDICPIRGQTGRCLPGIQPLLEGSDWA